MGLPGVPCLGWMDTHGDLLRDLVEVTSFETLRPESHTEADSMCDKSIWSFFTTFRNSAIATNPPSGDSR